MTIVREAVSDMAATVGHQPTIAEAYIKCRAYIDSVDIGTEFEGNSTAARISLDGIRTRFARWGEATGMDRHTEHSRDAKQSLGQGRNKEASEDELKLTLAGLLSLLRLLRDDLKLKPIHTSTDSSTPTTATASTSASSILKRQSEVEELSTNVTALVAQLECQFPSTGSRADVNQARKRAQLDGKNSDFVKAEKMTRNQSSLNQDIDHMVKGLQAMGEANISVGNEYSKDWKGSSNSNSRASVENVTASDKAKVRIGNRLGSHAYFDIAGSGPVR
ncbi:hypothetical protein AAFC00_002702 [Neodothiora populina]|uniref:Uncharacterized protein n=1 Tax=Neodothiora populina TaxID=2781224 RepID=A0ABR3P8C9_9PEZI